MSGDETVVFLVCAAAVVWRLPLWMWWYLRAPSMGWPRGMRWSFALMPVLCAAALMFVLKQYASWDVRDSAIYLTFYFIMGVAWVVLTLPATAFLGVGVRDDVIERHNPAAAWVCAGAMIAMTLGFAGGNIGDGPGWWVVVFCAALETAALFLLWAIAEVAGRFAESVTVERDVASGLRLGGLLAATGFVLGRAVAGDWVSYEQTVIDFAMDAAALPFMWFAAVMLHVMFRRSGGGGPMHLFTAGIIPALLYLACSVTWVGYRGWWT